MRTGLKSTVAGKLHEPSAFRVTCCTASVLRALVSLSERLTPSWSDRPPLGVARRMDPTRTGSPVGRWLVPRCSGRVACPRPSSTALRRNSVRPSAAAGVASVPRAMAKAARAVSRRCMADVISSKIEMDHWSRQPPVALHRFAPLRQVCLQDRPNARPAAVKQDALVAFAQVERLAYLVARPALHVAQQHDLALRRRQPVHGSADLLLELVRQ